MGSCSRLKVRPYQEPFDLPSFTQHSFSEVAEVRFSALDTPDDFPFTVERASGKLIVRQQLDREKREVSDFH